MGPGPQHKRKPLKKCGCLLQFVPLEDGVAILNRLKLEGKYSRADLVLGMDDAMLAEARKSGLFADHKVDLAPITMPGGWQDPTFLLFNILQPHYSTQLKRAPASFAQAGQPPGSAAFIISTRIPAPVLPVRLLALDQTDIEEEGGQTLATAR